MELFSGLTATEERLAIKAQILNLPLGGTMELLPLCNMNCRMCYVKQTKEEMKQKGSMLTVDEWIAIAESAQKAGVLYLLLTGGEPLIYPGFQRLYRTLIDMGFILTVNTNGTLLDEEWADFFAERPCRQINITLYGRDRKAYEELCGYADGYDRTLNAVRLLRQRGIPVRMSFTCTPYNAEHLRDFYEIAEPLTAHTACTIYCFPPIRKGGENGTGDRLEPKSAAYYKVQSLFQLNKTLSKARIAEEMLGHLLEERPDYHWREMHCRAGRCGFWINWRGELLPCGMFLEPSSSLKEMSFEAAWEQVGSAYRSLPDCTACEGCRLRPLCEVCPASCYTETGRMDGKPLYQCAMTAEFIRLLIEELEDDKLKNVYRELIRSCD